MFFDFQLWPFTGHVRLRMLATIALGVLAAVTGIVRLALLGWLVARIFAGDSLQSLLLPIGIVALVMLLRGALEYGRTMLAHDTAGRVQLELRKVLYDKVIELGPAYFGLERTGDVLLSLVEGVEQLETYFGQYLPQLVVALVTPLIIFVLMAFLDLPVAAVFLGFALFTLLVPALWHSWDSSNSKRRQHAYADFAAEFLDAIQGIATLKAFGQSGERGRQLAEKAHEVFRSTMWVLATNSLSRGITDTGLAVGAAVALGYGAYRVEGGAMSLEALLMILMMGIEVFRPQRDLRVYLHTGMVGQAAAQGIMEVLNAQPLIAPSPRGERAQSGGDLEATVEFDGVSFSYPGSRSAAHEQLSFSVAAGERISFVGSSGAGKSTIVKLLLRLYEPDQGRIRIGGRNLSELPADLIYQQIAVVNQDAYLFQGTVEDNLRFGKPDATQAELEAAARVANAHEFIERLPQGYRTLIGERGIRLSGGQRQRLAIARALLKDSPILILDEALSAVDAHNEAIIQQALEQLMQGRTTLIFAHRLSSVLGSDRILVLEHGHIVESGKHAELLAQHGVYYRLMAGQAQESRLGDDDDIIGERRADETDAQVLRETDESLYSEPTDAIIRAEGMGWLAAFRALFQHILPWKGKLTLTFLLGVVRVLALIGVGIVSALVVAAVKQSQPFTDYLIWLAVLAPLAGVLHWLESWFAHDMAFRLLAQMRIDLYNKLDELAPAYMVRRRTGDLVAMATHDVELVEYFFAHTVAPAFVAVLIPTLVLATLFYYHVGLAMALLPFLLLVGMSPMLARRRIDRLGSQAREALALLNAHAVDTIQGLSEIIAFRQSGPRRAEFVATIQQHLQVRLAFFRDLTLQTAILEIATGLGGLAIVATGAYLVSQGSLDATLLPLLTLLALAAFLPVSEIAHIGRQLADTLGATRRLYAVHNETVPVRDGERSEFIAAGETKRAALAMQHVSFSYFDNRRLALDDVSLQIPAGQTLALVGPSGAGKTTVAHLFLRFWDPQQGEVLLNGHDLREYRLETLREQIALVSQDTFLFNDTLRANILMAKPAASETELRAALERASLSEFIDTLPDGLETRAGERGVRLSGGQRQRIAIARAFLKDAPILILDEATSHLDAINELAVRRALEQLMSERTTVVIAHRLSTVRHADRIVVLRDGRVVETGTHDELLQREQGLYRSLVRRQLASAAAD
jgi:ATP-binding cassette subfamily C protein CydCD